MEKHSLIMYIHINQVGNMFASKYWILTSSIEGELKIHNRDIDSSQDSLEIMVIQSQNTHDLIARSPQL